MLYPTSHRGRFLIAFVAVAGHFIPASAVWACGKSCCSAWASHSCCQRILTNDQDLGSQCPLCRPQPTEQRSTPPCHCHLRARHDSATKAEARVALDGQHPGSFAVGRISDESAEAADELTRSALAAGETIPYRPPRIVYGVWRN